MASAIVSLVFAISAVVGWFGFKSVILLAAGTAVYLVDTMLHWKELNMNAKIVEFWIFAFGCIVAIFAKTPFYIGGMVSINIYECIVNGFTVHDLLKFK